MVKSRLIKLLCSSTVLLLPAQDVLSQPWIGVGGGVQTGWWVYYKGLDANGDLLGSDRTRHAPFLSAGGKVGWRFGRWDVGAQVQHIVFTVNRMEASDNAAGNLKAYSVADDNVIFLDYQLLASYKLMEKNWFSLHPRAGFGTFSINTSHPDKGNFGTKVSWSAGLQANFQFRANWSIVAAILHSIMHVQLKRGFEQERHRVYRSGLHLMLNYRITKCDR